jgi:hypothetical protein
MRLFDGDPRFYQYIIYTSADGRKYDTLVDRSKGEWRSWQDIRFPSRPVRFIKIVGLYGSDVLVHPSDKWFHVSEVEAYCDAK